MRLVTWNVNSLRARLPRVLEFLEQHNPDIAFLQETKVAADTFPVDELGAAGYDAVHHSAGQWAGVALLAKRGVAEIADTQFGLPGEPVAAEARWCEATIGGLRCASTYVPNGRTLDSPEYPRKLEFLDAIRTHLEQSAGDAPRVIAGDFNIAPADIDVYDPAAFDGGTHVTDAERTRLEAIEGTGLIDCYRHLHPETQQFTWWDYRAGNFHKGLGLRIDLFLASAELAPGITRCGIERDYRKGKKPSDHAPVVLEWEAPV
jgi:exodeoxyribonuclease-3